MEAQLSVAAAAGAVIVSKEQDAIALIVHFNQYSASTLTETAMESGIPRLQCKSVCVVQ